MLHQSILLHLLGMGAATPITTKDAINFYLCFNCHHFRQITHNIIFKLEDLMYPKDHRVVEVATVFK